MVKFLLWLKTRIPFIWKMAETVNGMLFNPKRLQERLSRNILKYAGNNDLEFRFLTRTDIPALDLFLNGQDQEQFKYFRPHPFDRQTIERLYRNPSFFMMGVFDNGRMIGYFFLRCFINRKCFTGRIVDPAYQGRGIAKTMGRILLSSAWESSFRVFGTASKHNIKSLSSYKAINDFRIIRELENDFIYFEYLKEKEKP